MKKIIFSAFILIVLVIVFGIVLKGGKELSLGISEGKFQPCPGTPNCVSSQAQSKEAYMEAISTGGLETEVVMKIARSVIEKSNRAKVVESDGPYLRAEFKSLIFRFVDDVEFYHDFDKGLLHFKSASRLGMSDMGVNRKRMEKLTDDISDEFAGLSDHTEK